MRTIPVIVGSLILCGCGGQDTDRGASPATTAQASAAPATASGLVTAETRSRCAGFGAAQAAEFLGVAATAVADRSQDITPTSRGCDFQAAGKKVTFTISLEDSIDEARRSLENMRQTYVASAAAQERATGKAIEPGAYSDILDLGDEAIWSVTNESLAVRHKNLTILVMAPSDKRQQVAVARKILSGVR